MNIPEFAVRRPVTIIMIFSAGLLLGMFALSGMNLALLPDIEPPAVSVLVPYPGASASDVESDITRRLEKHMNSVSDLERLESKSKDNLSLVTCVFDWGVDLNEAAADVRDKLDLARPEIKEHAPDADEPLLFKFSSAMAPVMIFTVSADVNYPDLYHIVDKEIVEPLKSVQGVGDILVQGGRKRRVNVEFDDRSLEARRITVEQVIAALNAYNINYPVGSVNVGLREYHMRVPGRYESLDQIRRLVIGGRGDSLVRLEHVARVSEGYEEMEQRAWADDKPGMTIIIQKQSGANTVRMAGAVKKKLDVVIKKLPPDIEINTVIDDSEIIVIMLKTLGWTVLYGAFFVTAVFMVFLRRFKTTVIILMSIPFSIIISFLGLSLLGYTINVISIMSLTVAVGIVVDNSIVVIENIVRHMRLKNDPCKSSIDGASELGPAITASTLTTVVVFVPLIFVGGITGIIFTQLAFVIIVTISISLMTSLMFVPMASSKLLREAAYDAGRGGFVGRLSDFFENRLNALEKGYGYLLKKALSHRKWVVGFSLLLAASTIAALPMVGTEFLPRADSGEVEIVVEMPEGVRIEETSRVAEEILERFVTSIPEKRASYGICGRSSDGRSTALGQKEGSNVLTVGTRLVFKTQRERSASDVADDLRLNILQQVAGPAKLSVSSVGSVQKTFFGSSSKPLSLEILGPDLDVSQAFAQKLAGVFEAVPGTRDVSLSAGDPRPELSIVLDREKAGSLGVNFAQAARTLRIHYQGAAATKYRDAEEDFDVFVRKPEYMRESIKDVLETTLLNDQFRQVRLGNVSIIREEFGPVEIQRKNQERLIKVEAGLHQRSLGEVRRDIDRRLSDVDNPPDVRLEWGGEVREQRKAFRDLTMLLILGIILVYMVMASQFESFADPFIILFCVPLAMIGVVWTFILTDTLLNLMSFIGLIMLVGIIVNNGIVLVDYANQLGRRSVSDIEVVMIEAGKTRLRPVLMTALTTILGMTPMALSRGDGSELWKPLGMTIIGGLLVGTLITLILIPVIYTIVHSGRKETGIRDA